jgi:hypothetical protein
MRRRGLSISTTDVRFDDDTMWVSLADGRTLGVPLAWFPRLMAASPEDSVRVEISPFGLHWESLDKDLSVPLLMAKVAEMAAE